MVKNSKRVIKEKQGTRLPFFLAVSLVFHTIAAVAAPAIIDYYADKPRNIQNLAYVDVVEGFHHAPAVEKASAPKRYILAQRGIKAQRDTPASTASSNEISAPAEKTAEVAPDSDISSAGAPRGGPLKPSGGETLVASVEKNSSAPGVPDGTLLSRSGSPGDGLMPAGEKGAGGGRGGGWGRGRLGVGDIKSYAGGPRLIMFSGEGAGLKSAAGHSSVPGMGPAFSPAEIKTAEGAGTSEGAGRSEGAGGILTAKLEKASGAGQATWDGQGEAAAVAGSAGAEIILERAVKKWPGPAVIRFPCQRSQGELLAQARKKTTAWTR